MNRSHFMKVRVSVVERKRIEQGANASREKVSEFVRGAALRRAEKAIRRRPGVPSVPSGVLLALLALLGACGEPEPTSLVVHVEGGTRVTADQIRATFHAGTMNDVRLFPPAQATVPLDFPTAFSITLDASLAGPLDVRLEGLDQGEVTSHGTNRAMVRSNAISEVTVRLVPGEDPCGNGQLDSGEECDDNNRIGGDGCDPLCRTEKAPADGGVEGACASCADANTDDPGSEVPSDTITPETSSPETTSPETPENDAMEIPAAEAGALEQGAPCSRDSECMSGFCTDGFCCNSRCHTRCLTCSGKAGFKEGRCTPAITGTDPDNDCGDGMYCAGASSPGLNTCKSGLENGAPCSDPGTYTTECASGACSPEGICCNNICDKFCQSCTVTGRIGTCSYVPSGEPWGTSTSAGQCNGPGVFCDGTGKCNKPRGMGCYHRDECLSRSCSSSQCN